MLVNLNNKECYIGDFGVSYPYKVQSFMGGASFLELTSPPTIQVSFAFDDKSGLPLFIIDNDIKIPVLGLTLHLSGNDDSYYKIMEPGKQLKFDLCYSG